MIDDRTESDRPARGAFPELQPSDVSLRMAAAALRSRQAPGRPRDIGSIRATALSFRNMHEHGDLLVRYLEARRSVFVERLRWNASDVDGMEFDQYDTPFCRWIVLHEFGQVIGGVRLVPTTARNGIYSYLLRDAQMGVLDGIPSDVLFFRAPVEPNVWEASRFFITDAVPAMRRSFAQRMLLDAMTEAARRNGASYILGVVPGIWSRWARRLGEGATPVGARFAVGGAWNQSILFHIPAEAPGDAPDGR